MIVKQGDAYQVPIELNMNGLPIPEEDIAAVEVYFGELRKTYPDGVSYQDGVLYFPLTQEETFALQEEETLFVDIRVTFANGSCIGIPEKLPVSIADAVSTEVL